MTQAAWAAPADRSLWLIETLSHSTVERLSLSSFKGSLIATQRSSEFYQAIRARARIKWLDINAGYLSQPSALNFGPSGFRIGVGRYALAGPNHYGQLTLNLFHLDSSFSNFSTNEFIELAIDTGVFAHPESPWQYELQLRVLQSYKGERPLFLVAIRTWHQPLASQPNFELGGLLSWAYRTEQNEATLDNPVENMLISVGPVARLNSRWGTGTLSARWRLWLDTQAIDLGNGQLIQATTIDSSTLPSFELSWTILY